MDMGAETGESIFFVAVTTQRLVNTRKTLCILQSYDLWIAQIRENIVVT
jgi:hypothetical protein